jgi:hypothetical protein
MQSITVFLFLVNTCYDGHDRRLPSGNDTSHIDETHPSPHEHDDR